MRIPFDLIAAVLVISGLMQYFRTPGVFDPSRLSASEAGLAWLGFIAIAWLLNELVTRRVEWASRFGAAYEGLPNASGRARHPVELQTLLTRVTQALTVGLYALLLWHLQWPVWVQMWPEWLGLSPSAKLRLPQWLMATDPRDGLPLSESSFMLMVLNLAPFMLAMLAGWLPKRRLSGTGRFAPSLWHYLGFEAKMTWMPLLPWLALSILADVGSMLPRSTTTWMAEPGVDLLLLLVFLFIMAAVALPAFLVWQWRCTPLPEGELKERLQALVDKSGVKARAIMYWGQKGSGFMNACVLGPWARFRYVLISPALVERLGIDETEAVLAHELGHARHGHLTLLFFVLLCMSAVLEPLVNALPFQSPVLQTAFMLGFVILYIWGFFGSVIRRCEREADLASAELMGSPVPLINALEKVACHGGNIRNVYCWHHGSIAQRVEAVARLSVDPRGSLQLHNEVRRVRILFVVLTVVAVGAQFLQHLV